MFPLLRCSFPLFSSSSSFFLLISAQHDMPVPGTITPWQLYYTASVIINCSFIDPSMEKFTGNTAVEGNK